MAREGSHLQRWHCKAVLLSRPGAPSAPSRRPEDSLIAPVRTLSARSCRSQRDPQVRCPCSQLLPIEFVRNPCWRMHCQLSQHRSIRQGAQLLPGGRGARCRASGSFGCSCEASKQLQKSQQLSCCTMFGHFEAVTVVSINILQEG